MSPSSPFPEGKRYRPFTSYYKALYGQRLQKLVLDAGFTCPNRDGKVGTGGCTYCDNAAFHPGYATPGKTLPAQIDEGLDFHRKRYPRTAGFLAYFQSYSNTYGDLQTLRQVYEKALSHPSIVGIAIGTRPDCIDEWKLDYLADLQQGKVLSGWSREGFEHPLVTLEYGIESCYDKTLLRINRGHDFECAARAVRMTAERGIDTGAHMILGLPGETLQMMKDECAIINSLPLLSVKFHQLQIVRGTEMEKEFAQRPEDFCTWSLPEYLDFAVDMLERLRPDLYIERIAGEVPPRFVSQTSWGLVRNVEILRMLDERLAARNTFQGARI